MAPRRPRDGRRAAAVGLALLAAAIGPPAAAQAPPAGSGRYALSITGAPGTRYEGRCTVSTTSGGEEVVELSGVVPRGEAFTGAGVACRVHAHGPLTIDIAGPAGRSVSTTSGGLIAIAVR